MKNKRKKIKYNSPKSSYVLQLTAMVDMFTIMLVFLLNSFSSSAIHVTPNKDLSLPMSSVIKYPDEALKLVVSRIGVFLEDKKVTSIIDGKIEPQYLGVKDPDFIRPLFDEADRIYKEKFEKVGENNEQGGKENGEQLAETEKSDEKSVANNTTDISGDTSFNNDDNGVSVGQDKEDSNKPKIILQADAKLPYETLKKVMYTLSLVGFVDIKLATLMKD